MDLTRLNDHERGARHLQILFSACPGGGLGAESDGRQHISSLSLETTGA